MSFVYPLGLLGLIGVPILIIIYILKNKHTEQIVTSTYLWDLSEKFLAKKRPISLMSGLISLLLQIIAVVAISLLIAQPIITIPNSAKEYCFILDGSGSMNTSVSEVSRIEIGKGEIEEIINDSHDGSKYTLLFAADSTRVIYEKITDKQKACELLNLLETTGVTSSLNSSLKYAQEYFNTNNSLETYLVTDKDYESNNLKVINVSSGEENYSIVNAEYFIDVYSLRITGNVFSAESDAILELEIYIDGILEKALEVQAKKLQQADFSYECDKKDFSDIKILIKNKDCLNHDNVYYLYNVEKKHEYKTLLVSDNPFYLGNMIKTIGVTELDVLLPVDYNTSISGYGLYIFDSYTPNKLPTDGTVWLFGVDSNITGSGFAVQESVENEEGMLLEYPKNSTTLFKMLTSNLNKEAVYVSKYIKYGLFGNFTILMNHNNNPVVFTGINEYGNREVVFAFDLHDSNLPLMMDYLLLSKNLLDYSFPIIIDELSYICGDTVDINVLSNCDSIRVESPSGNVSYLDVSAEIAEFQLVEVGNYKITIMFGDEEKVFSIFSQLPNEESYTSEEVVNLSLQGESSNDFIDGFYDKLIILFIVLLVIYMADWMVYCYEQHQLR